MDLQATVMLRNMPPDTDAESVEGLFRSTVCEWLDFDRRPGDLSVTVGPPTQPDTRSPIYCISDLHLGDGGPRDNFTDGRMREFQCFLDYIERERAHLLILGDLFEFWQANVSRVIMRHLGLLDRLADMGAIYVLGNHDADLLHFCDTAMLRHTFFDRMVPEHEEQIGGWRVKFIHGHQADPYCKSDTPGKGRISAIYSGIWEDRHGSPWIGKYRTVEEATVGRVERLLSLFYRLMGRPNRFRALNRTLAAMYRNYDVIVSGHTHRPGRARFGKTYLYNTGTWAERVNSCVCIRPGSSVRVLNWSLEGLTWIQPELPI